MSPFLTKPIAVAITIAVFSAVLSVLAIVLLYGESNPALPTPTEVDMRRSVIGASVEGRVIEAYTYTPRRQTDKNEEAHIVFVGGVHGGYEWNSVLLAYAFIDHLAAYPEIIPANVTVTVIPSANPDGVYRVVGKEGRFTIADIPANAITEPGRFNANNVDINRNFNCKWKPESMWRGSRVSAGSAPFSEPETRSLRDFVLENNPQAVLFWHSQANAVYASECREGILPQTLAIANAYARASGYPAVETFDQYEITGDAEGWLASIGIPAITVELKTHEGIEWERNVAGVRELFKYFARWAEY